MRSSSNRFLKAASLGLAVAGGLLAPAVHAQENKLTTPSTSSSSSKSMPWKSSEERQEAMKDRQKQADTQKQLYQQMVRDYEARQEMEARGLDPNEATARQANAAKAEKAIPRAEPVKPDSVVGWISNNNWQRWAEIRSGNVIFLRRSTNEPAKPDETVILRWRTPNEHAKRQGMSSKRSFPNKPMGPQKEWFERIAAGEEE